MSKAIKANKVQRVVSLKARFAKIKSALQATDILIDSYLEGRGNELEAFAGELKEWTTPEAEEAADAAH